MNEHWVDRLSEYVDGEMSETDVAAIEEHLARCASCQAVLAQIRQVTRRARALDDTPPARDLWTGIAGVIGVEPLRSVRPQSRRITFSVPQLLAASITLIVLSAGAAWLWGEHVSETRQVAVNRPQTTVISAGTNWTSDPGYAAAVAELESTLEEGRRSGRLDSITIRVVEHNLAIVDTAIAQARHALQADPGSAYLNHHLAETMQRKLELLRSATALTAART